MNNKNFHKQPLSPRVRRHRRRRRLILGGVAVALAALIVAIVFLVRGCAGGASPSDDSSATPSGGSSTSGETTTQTSAAETTTQAPTTTEVPTTEATTAPTVPAAVDDSYFADACFIGDSRTQGLLLYAGPGNATNFTSKGLNISQVFNSKTVKLDNQEYSVNDALGMRQFGKVYIMLGVNELGWTYPQVFVDQYGDLIDRIKETSPDADIFVQSILPVTAARSAKGDHVNNDRIAEYNAMLKDLCREKGAAYLNVQEAVEDENGCLPADATTDGVHLNKTYCLKWLDYLKTHTDAASYIPE